MIIVIGTKINVNTNANITVGLRTFYEYSFEGFIAARNALRPAS